MTELTTFHPFPELPIELRLKIWSAALPSRVVAPELDCDSRLIFGEHNSGLIKPRPIPAILAVNSESRSFCLEQYVPFASTYIHPSLDILLFSTEDEKRFWLTSPSFYHISDHPAGKLKAIAIEVAYDKPDMDFSGHLYWIRGLGCPQELIICPAPTRGSTSARLDDYYQRISETVLSTGWDGRRSQLVTWPDEIDGQLVKQIKPKLLQALQEEKNSRPEFQIPRVRDELYFAVL